MENTNSNTYTRPSTLSRPLSAIGAGRFYAPSQPTPTFNTAEADPATQVHEALTRPASAPARGDVMEMRSSPTVPTINNVLQRGASVQGESSSSQGQAGGHQYRGVEMTSYQVPNSLRPGHSLSRGRVTPPWDAIAGGARGQAEENVWRAPAW
jgi:hypothetical protein